MPMPERVIIVGHFKCEEAAVTLRQLVVVRVLAMGGRVMVVCAQVRSVIVVDMDMIAAGVSVKEDPRARQRHRREEQAQRRGRQARDAGSPLPHDCCYFYHISKTWGTHFMLKGTALANCRIGPMSPF